MSDISLASAVCTGAERARFRRAIAAHFAGRIDPDGERRLRTHLPACPACRRFYGRALALSAADPQAPSARERLARGLGLAPASPAGNLRSHRRIWAWLMAPALAALALVAVKLTTPAELTSAAPAPSSPAARGGQSTTAPALLAYQIPPGGTPRALERAMRGHDELAFAYANAGGLPYLLIFGVDEHAHVYWYQPVWRAGTPPPLAVAALPGPGPHEIPAAIRHDLDGRRLVIYAVFAPRPVGVAEIERAARAAGAADRLILPVDLQVIRRSVEVQP